MDGGLELLAGQAFLRTRSGDYARPDDCYYWSAALEALLGDESGNWVNEDWVPVGRDGSRFRDLLESRLGMRSTVSVKHIVDRIANIAESSTIDEIAKRTAPIIRHILDRYSTLTSEDRVELERLRSIAFLPGEENGERVQDTRYTPAEVYRVFRSPGFSSQVTIVDLPPLRGGARGGAAVTEFLDLLKMPAEPPIVQVVAHLEHCMTEGIPVSDLTYAILSERLDEPDAGCIDRLVDTDFIYDSNLQRYLPAHKVFWERPPFGGHWHVATDRMRQREALYRHLGVVDAPSTVNYATLLVEIASQAHPSIEDAGVHARCLTRLAEDLDQGIAEVEQAIDALQDQYALLNLNGDPVRTDDAIWVDSEGLATPFGNELDECLVAPPPAIHRTAATRFFKQMGVAPLSEIARLRLASTPDLRPAPDLTEILRERADLLLWLAPTHEFRKSLRGSLSRIEARLTDSLQVYAEIIVFDPPVRSPASSTPAFYDPETDILHIRIEAGQSVNWIAAFRALFSHLDNLSHGVDMRPVFGTATLVMSQPTWNDAEQALRSLEYLPPEEIADDLPLGGELGDAPDEPLDDGVDRGALSGAADETEILPLGNEGDNDEREKLNETDLDDQCGDSSGLTAPINDDPYKSKADAGAFGIDPSESSSGATRNAGGLAGGAGSGGKSRHRATNAERQARRSRMLSYVGTSGDKPDAPRRVGDDDDISELIDIAAITAVMKYEQARGWVPEEQPHGNPGYDIISKADDGASRRLIEVKGLEGPWTERGIKLSHVQYRMAETYPEEFWIYVVENARDLQSQRVNAIANPFSKVEEYWFDDRWKCVSEESATARDVNIRIGAQVRHDAWGIGTIIAFERRGMMYSLTIDFGRNEGRRNVPYTSSLKFVD